MNKCISLLPFVLDRTSLSAIEVLNVSKAKKKIKHKKTDCEMKKTHDDFFF